MPVIRHRTYMCSIFVIFLFYVNFTSSNEYKRESQDLTSIPNDIPKSATYVSLLGNKITEIPENVWNGYTQIVHLTLKGNRIRTILDDSFSGKATISLLVC